MTKEITKAFILQEIENRFALREFLPEKFLFSETVIPIYDIESHLGKYYANLETVSITAGPAAYTFFTIPENERWVFSIYDIIFMGAATITVAGLFIKRQNKRTSNATPYLDLAYGQTVSYHTELNNPVVVEPGDEICIYVDGYTSTQDLRLVLDSLVSVIR